VERARQVERPLAGDDRLERFAGDELHDDEEDVLLLLGGEDRDDVRVTEAGQQPRLAQQLAEVDRLLVRHLEGDALVDPGVLGEVDGAEAAAADRRQDLVLADDLTAEEHPRRSIAARALHSRRSGPRSARRTRRTRRRQKAFAMIPMRSGRAWSCSAGRPASPAAHAAKRRLPNTSYAAR